MEYREFVKQEMRRDPPRSRHEAALRLKAIARKWRALQGKPVRPNPVRLDLVSGLVGGVLGFLIGKATVRAS